MESQSHMDLVKLIVKYLKKCIPDDEHAFIQVDSSGQASSIRVTDNYIPDVSYKTNQKLFIGEAKTYEDFERKHSKDQFDAYIRDCGLFLGEAKLVVAVPWQLLLTAQNYFRRIKKRTGTNVEIVILDDMGSERIL